MDLETVDFNKSRRSLVSLSVGILAVWLLDVKIHELKVWGIDVQQNSEGYLYILVFAILIYIFLNFMFRKRTVSHLWRKENHDLGGIQHELNMSLANLEGYSIVLDRLNYMQLIYQSAEGINKGLEKIIPDGTGNIDELDQMVKSLENYGCVSEYTGHKIEAAYEVIDDLSKQLKNTREEVGEQFEKLSHLKYWSSATYTLLDVFFPYAFFVLAVIACLERIVVLNGIWAFLINIF